MHSHFDRLFALCLAFAVLLAPAVARAGVAFAGIPDHQMQMMGAGQCQMPASGAADHGKDYKSCCISVDVARVGLVSVRRPALRPDFAAGSHDRLMINLGGAVFAGEPDREIELQKGDAVALRGAEAG